MQTWVINISPGWHENTSVAFFLQNINNILISEETKNYLWVNKGSHAFPLVTLLILCSVEIILNYSSMPIVVCQFCHILPGSRDWIWPVATLSFHPFLLRENSCSGKTLFRKRHAVIFWRLLMAQCMLHITTVLCLLGRRCGKEEGEYLQKKEKEFQMEILLRLLSMTSPLQPQPCACKERRWCFQWG